jgi:hypothetical protein
MEFKSSSIKPRNFLHFLDPNHPQIASQPLLQTHAIFTKIKKVKKPINAHLQIISSIGKVVPSQVFPIDTGTNELYYKFGIKHYYHKILSGHSFEISESNLKYTFLHAYILT